MSAELGGCRVLLKREDLCHTGAHKVNNTLGQVLLARRMGKTRIIAETGAGQHGVATATAAALFGLPCDVYMGAVDVERQALNVFRMELLGARVIPVRSGSRTLKDAMNEALRDWVTNVRRHPLHHRLGGRAAPLPGAWCATSRASSAPRRGPRSSRWRGGSPTRWWPAWAAAPTPWGSSPASSPTRRCGWWASRRPATGSTPASTARRWRAARPGVLHGSRSYVLQDANGQIVEAHSISAGLDYPGVGPELAWLKDQGRVELRQATDDEALDALTWLARLEGIIPALETAHAVHAARGLARELGPGGLMIVNISGRGDKDVDTVRKALAARAAAPAGGAPRGRRRPARGRRGSRRPGRGGRPGRTGRRP